MQQGVLAEGDRGDKALGNCDRFSHVPLALPRNLRAGNPFGIIDNGLERVYSHRFIFRTEEGAVGNSKRHRTSIFSIGGNSCVYSDY